MKELVTLLKKYNLTISSCESLSGGLFAAKLVEIPGVSSVFVGSVVTYATRVKHEVVHVKQETIDKYGVVSEEVANEMASNIARLMKSDIGVSFTGNAGPDVMEGKPAGLVYSSIYYESKVVSYSDMISGTRNEVRNQIVELMTQRLLMLISKEKQNG